jgi:5'-AMP-activated protein kinase regulatory gamma subunit
MGLGLAKQFGQCNQLRTFLSNKTLQDMEDLDKQKLIVLDSEMSLQDTFQQLAKHHIHSAPVYNAQLGEYVGLVDWKDFATYCVRFYSDVVDEQEADELLTQQNAVSLVDLSQQNPYYPIFPNTPMLSVIQGFGTNGVHRRPVIEQADTNSVYAMVSQTAVVKWLAKHKDELGPTLKHKTIFSVLKEEVDDPLCHKVNFVMSVTKHSPILGVLKVLVENDVNGLAVVQEDKLVGNISVSDLQYLLQNQEPNLGLTVGEFLELVPRRPLVTCSPIATVEEVIDKFAQEGVHRLYIVEDDMRPLAVITLTDLMNAIYLMATAQETT